VFQLKDSPSGPAPLRTGNGDREDSDRPDTLEGSTSAPAGAIPVATEATERVWVYVANRPGGKWK